MMPILIVDDSREDLLLVDRLIRQCKILNPAFLFASGKECISWFQQQPHRDQEPPCLLLLDLIMSPVSGIQILEHLSRENLATAPAVVMMSGLTDVKLIHKGYQLGAHTFLVKPLNCEDILQMLNSLKILSLEKTTEGYIISTHSTPTTPKLELSTGKISLSA